MTARIISFPLVRRVGLIRSQAERLSYQTPRAFENLLHDAMMRQRDALLRKGADPAEVEAQVKALRQAICDEVNRIIYQRRPHRPGGAA